MSSNYIEVIKTLSSILGCILSIITLSGILIKPIRKAIFKKIGEWAHTTSQDEAIKIQSQAIECNNKQLVEIKENVNQLVAMVTELNDRVFRNESDRLRAELFACGNRCRRKIPLSGEEFRHIQNVFAKYSVELHCNGIGKDEYDFIVQYFNAQESKE